MEEYLVVDRALTVTRQVRDLLEAQGVDPGNVHEAFTADEALDVAREHRPAVVILAVDLPDMGGHELAKDIQSLDPTVQVVVHTSLANGDSRVREATSTTGGPRLLKPLGSSEAAAIVDPPALETGPDDEIAPRDREIPSES